MADSCEATAFQSCFDRLKTGLQDNLNDIAPKLFARGLISDGSQRRVLSRGTPCDERATDLVTVLLGRIRADPPSFYWIIVELEACPVLEVLANGLKEELKRVKREAAVQQRLQAPTCAPVSLCALQVFMEFRFVLFVNFQV